MNMARSRRSRKRRSRSKSNIGAFATILGALAVLAILVGAGVFLFLNTEKEIALNDDDLCPNRGSRGTVAVLLDTTDELAAVTKSEVRESILNMQRELPRFYRASVYTFDEKGLSDEPLASVCNPGSLNQMDDLARQGLTANPALINRKFSEFENKISSAIASVFRQKFEAKQSPILGSLQNLGASLPRPVDIDDEKYLAGRNKVILVTDFLEHTEVFSNYRSGLNMTAFANSRATEKFGKSYKDIDLNVLLVRRNVEGFTTMQLAQFWAQIFKSEFKSDILSIKILSGEL